MERIVALLVPHGFWDGLGRMSLLLVLVCSWAFISHYGVFGGHYPTRLHYLAHVLFVALPPVIAIFRMLTYLNFLQKRLLALAATDALTGLANRRAFFDAASVGVARGGGVMLVVDVDHFKSTNDTFGHKVGDRCLVELAGLMREQTRGSDVVGRIGGEEFAIFLGNASLATAREVGERLAEGVQIRDETGHDDIRVTTSVGAALSGRGEDIDALLVRADEMMYAAKRAGRARLRVWEDGAAFERVRARRTSRLRSCHGTDMTPR